MDVYATVFSMPIMLLTNHEIMSYQKQMFVLQPLFTHINKPDKEFSCREKYTKE